jgi:hypothetical protein
VPLGAGTGTVRQAAEEGVDVEPPAAAGVVVEAGAVALAELWLVLLPQPAAPRTMATTRHALRTAVKQTRLHLERLGPSTPKLLLTLRLPLTEPLPPTEPMPMAAPLLGPPLSRHVGSPHGLRRARSSFWVATPAGVVTSAAFTSSAPGHQATNQPPPAVARTFEPSSRTSVTPLTPAPVRPSANE